MAQWPPPKYAPDTVLRQMHFCKNKSKQIRYVKMKAKTKLHSNVEIFILLPVFRNLKTAFNSVGAIVSE